MAIKNLYIFISVNLCNDSTVFPSFSVHCSFNHRCMGQFFLGGWAIIAPQKFPQF